MNSNPAFAWQDIDNDFDDEAETKAIEEILMDMIARQREHHGDDLKAPCPEAKELLDQWHKDTGEDYLALWRGMVARSTTDAKPKAVTEIPMILDAYLLGESTPEMEKLLDTPITLMGGNLYDQGDRRNTKDGEWKASTFTWYEWMVLEKIGLCNHPVAKSKQGPSLVFAESLGGARKDSAIKTMASIGLDIDSGASLDDVIERLIELKLFALVYTSFSHGKSRIELKHDDIVRKLKLDTTPNRSQVQAYLREHHKDRFDAEFINSIEVIDFRHQTKDGLRIIVETPPLDKFRVIIPLAEPVELSDLGTTLSQWKTAWEDAVCGVAVNMLGVNFDSTSCDVNRLFYTPRHPADAEDWYACVIQGEPLKFEEIEPYSKSAYVKNRDDNDPFAKGTSSGGDERETFYTPAGLNLNRWHSKHKERFLITDVIETFCDDKIVKAGNERVGTVHVQCPFEHEHSTTGGTATMCMNPTESSEGYWTVFCHHDACTARHKLEFLKEMIDQDWFDEALLADNDFNLGVEDSEIDNAPEPVSLDSVEIAERISKSGLDRDSSDADIRSFIDGLVNEGADNATEARAINALSNATSLKKPALNRAFKNARETRRADARNQEGGDVPVLGVTDDPEMVAYVEQRLFRADEYGSPVVYQYQGDIAVVRNNKRDMISKDQFGAVVNTLATFKEFKGAGDLRFERTTFAPDDIIKQAFNNPVKPYPELAEVKKSPFFSHDGRLVSDEGYDASSKTYLHLDGLEVPRVSAEPTGDEVYEAKRLFIEEAFGDFPFGGVKERDERVSRILDNEGESLPDAAHAIALTLERFVRDMIEGCTPCYAVAKPAPGTGGGLLVEVASLIATGEAASAQTMPASDEEFTKVMGALVNEGGDFCFFDNMNASVASEVFASALTAPKVKVRLLGSSRMIDAPVRHTWVAVANNMKGSGEILRRLVLIELNSRVAEPTKRNDWRHADLKDWVVENRARLVWACLTLIQNWIAMGQEPWEGPIKQSFGGWSRVIGGILRDAEIRGFLENEDHFRSYAANAEDGGIHILMGYLAQEFKTGTAFRPGGVAEIRGFSGNVASLQDALNSADDNKPLLLNGWGYNREDSAYNQPRGIAKNFRDVARGTYRVTLLEGAGSSQIEVEYELNFEEHTDPKSPAAYYWVMTKTRVSGDQVAA